MHAKGCLQADMPASSLYTCVHQSEQELLGFVKMLLLQLIYRIEFLFCRMPNIGELSLYDVVGTPGVAADVSHMDSKPKVV